jgi:hypothetical protein
MIEDDEYAKVSFDGLENLMKSGVPLVGSLCKYCGYLNSKLYVRTIIKLGLDNNPHGHFSCSHCGKVNYHTGRAEIFYITRDGERFIEYNSKW